MFKFLRMLFGAKEPQAKKASKPSFTEAPRQINEMVQDPVCKIYIPKKEAVCLDNDGTGHYFCSRDCLEKFQKKDDMR